MTSGGKPLPPERALAPGPRRRPGRNGPIAGGCQDGMGVGSDLLFDRIEGLPLNAPTVFYRVMGLAALQSH